MAKLTTRQAAQRLGKSQDAVLKYIAQGLLPATPEQLVPGAAPYWMIDEEDLATFVPPMVGRPPTNRYNELAQFILEIYHPTYPPHYLTDLALPFKAVIAFFRKPHSREHEDYREAMRNQVLVFWREAQAGRHPGRAIGTEEQVLVVGDYIYDQFYIAICEGQVARLWSRREAMIRATAGAIETLLLERVPDSEVL